MRIRIANENDWERIIEIYNQAVKTGFSTADISPVSVESRADWLREHAEDQYAIYIEENEEEIMGWCSISPYRSGRMALRYTAEISYYIAMNYWRRGVASLLIKYAIEDCTRLGIKTLFGILLDTNEVSINLLKTFGFERWGYMPNVADFNGHECGHLYMGKRIKISTERDVV